MLEGQVITYKKLNDYVLSIIRENCVNIESDTANPIKYSTSYPIDNAAIVMPRNAFSKTYVIDQTTLYPNNANLKKDVQVSVTFNNADNTILNSVATSVVNSQLSEFLAARGLNTGDNSVVNFKTIMNYFNHISTFLSVKLVKVTSSFIPGEPMLYYDSSVKATDIINAGNILTVTSAYAEGAYSKAQITKDINAILSGCFYDTRNVR